MAEQFPTTGIETKFLGYEGTQRLVTRTRDAIADAEQAAKTYAKNYADGLAENYDAAGTAATKVNELANGQVKTNTEHIGTMDNLETTAKADLVTAINEVRNAVSAGGTAAAITMTESTEGLSDGVAKAYVLKQGDNTVGTINIPKDMVVQSGEVVVNPEGYDAGTYIKMVLANATNDEIFVNVGSLVDIYKGSDSASLTQGVVDIVVNSASRVITAVVADQSITSDYLASDAVTTAKIADGNVTKAKLSTAVQASLDKADAAAQAATDAAAQALADAKDYADGLDEAMNTRVEALEAIDHDHANKAELDLIVSGDKAKWDAAEGNAKTYADGLNTAMNTRVEALEAIDHDHANKAELDLIVSGDKAKWDAAEGNAKTYADGLNTAMDARVHALESWHDLFVEITAADINAMFNTVTPVV